MERYRSRRNFLKIISALCGGTILLTATNAPLMAQVSSQKFGNLSVDQAEKLFLMAYALFPHAKVDKDHYWAVIKQFDTMSGDAGFRGLISSGLADLDKAASNTWEDISGEEKEQVLQAIQAGPFFQTVRILTLLNFYGNPDVGTALGYEGSSFEEGGYLHRGFNDLDWLQEPLS